MAVIHIAWFRFKEQVDSKRIDEHMAACRSLVGRVPVVIDLKCGKSYTDRAGGLTHGILVTVPDREAIVTYLNHPLHVPVASALKADLDELRVMDIEV